MIILAVLATALSAATVTIDLRSLQTDDVRVFSLSRGCVIGVASAEGVLAPSTDAFDSPETSVYVVPDKKPDSVRITRREGRLLKLCGSFKIDQECWNGTSVCAPYRHAIMLRKLRML